MGGGEWEVENGRWRMGGGRIGDGKRWEMNAEATTGGAREDGRWGDIGEGLGERRAVTVLGRFLSQLRAKLGISGVFWGSCVTFPAKTVTALQVAPAR